MTITLTIPPGTEAAVRRRAADAGKSVEGYGLPIVQAATTSGTAATVLAAAIGPHLPAEWVDELERLIAEG